MGTLRTVRCPLRSLWIAAVPGLIAGTAGTAGAQNASNSTAPPATATTGSAPAEAKPNAEGILPIPDYSGDLWRRAYLTGDWNGARTDLAHKGIQFNVDWVQTVQSIVSGGLDTGTRYGGSLDYLLNVDFYRMGVLPGALLSVRAETRYGESVNGLAGPILPVNTDGYFPLSEDDIPITVTDLTYYQFLSEEFGVFLGKFDTLSGDPNPFASGRGDTQFMNSNFIFNTVSALTVPYSTLGVGVIVSPCKYVTIASTIMNTADSSTTSGFGQIGDGWTWSTELNVQYRLGSLPGGQNLTYIYAGDNSYFNIGGKYEPEPGVGFVVPTKSSSWAVMWSGWQYLFTEDEQKGPIDLGHGPPDVQGFGLFSRVGFADKDTNPTEWSVSGGIGGQGIIPGRDHDRFGIGYYYSSFQTGRFDALSGVGESGQGFEAYYQLALTPAAQLTFDIQTIDSFQPNTDAAVILGARLMLNF